MELLEGQSADTYVGARFGERFEHKLTETTKIWQTLEYIPQVDRWTEKYLVLGEVGIDTAITKKLSLRTVVQGTHDSEPAASRKKRASHFLAG